MASDSPTLIGWKERVNFPDWGERQVRAKIDTGARTSAIGADSCLLIDDSADGMLAELQLALHRRRPERRTTIRAPVLGFVVVTNSGGVKETRPIIETHIKLGQKLKLVRFTITNRATMRFPVILGRRALAGDFVVDVTRSFTQKKRK